MTYATNVQSPQAGIADRLAAFLKDVSTAYAQRRLFRITVRELRALTTRELTDLGIARSEIAHLARIATYGK